MLIKSEPMHIDTANKVTMSCKATGFTGPISILGFVLVPTYRTLATRSSFRASEAHDVSLFGFVSQVIDILAIFPHRHPLVVVPPAISIAHTMGIPNEELANFVLNTEIDHLTGSFVSQITNAALCSRFDLVLGTLQLLPSAGIFLASGLLLGKFSQLLAPLPLQRPDTTTCDDHGLSCVSADGCQVDLTQIYRCVQITRCFLCLWLLDTDVQLKTVVPNQAASAAVFRKFDRHNDGGAAFAHRQNNAPLLTAHRLSRPFDEVEALGMPRVLHPQIGMRLTELTCRSDGGKKGMHHHLHRLTMQGKLSFGGLLQFAAPGPLGMLHPCLFVDLTTAVPHLGRFHLSSLQASKQLRSGVQSIHTYCMHAMIIVWKQVACKWEKPGGLITGLGTIWSGSPHTAERSLPAGEVPTSQKRCGKDRLWSSSYYVGTTGSVSAEVIRRYIS